MPHRSYPFASTRVKAKENALMTREKASRLLDTQSPEEAMKLLSDFGYSDAAETPPENFEKCITTSLKEAYKFIAEVTPDARVTNLFFLRFDYHNLKAILKGEYAGTSAVSALIKGTMDPANMHENVREKRYREFPEEMAKALIEIDKRFAASIDVSLIGLLLDSAYAAQVTRELKDIKEEYVHEYFAAEFDFSNISALIRLKRADAGKELLERAILPGGNIKKDTLRRAYEMGAEEMMEFLLKSQYRKQLSVGFEYYQQTGSFARLIKEKDDYLSSLAVKYRSNAFSIAPVLAFLVGKVRETQAVRMIMVAKLNGMPKSNVADILPALL